MVIVVSEVIGYHSLLMNSMALPSKAPRCVECHSSLATSHSMLSAAPVATQAPRGASCAIYLSRLRESRRADSNRLPLLQLRVIIQALQGFAQACKSRISRQFSFLRFALRCTVLRSRWYQSGINVILVSTRD